MIQSPFALKAGDTFLLRSQSSKLETLNYTARFSDERGKNVWDEEIAVQAATDDRLIAQSTYRVDSDRHMIWMKCSDQLEAAIERGTTFIEVYLSKGQTKPYYTFIGDYLYTDHYPQWPGKIVERGPGGGEGRFLLNPIVNAEAVGADFIVDIGPPANEIWKVHELKIKYKASAGVGSRSIATTRLDEDGVGIWSLAAMAPTASQDADIYMTDILIGERGSITPVDIAVEIQTRPFMLPKGHRIRLEDTADISATDAVSVFGVVEAWLGI